MNRQYATKILREELDNAGLKDWHIRLSMDIKAGFLGMCSEKDKTIILNAFHIDTHPDVEIVNTIKHEVAHAIVGCNHQHDDIWSAKARELGCDNTLPCASYSLSDSAIDAIRSGAELKVGFEEEINVIRKPKYTIQKLQEKCLTCGKIAIKKSQMEFKTSEGRKLMITYECNHVVIREADSTSAFEDIVFDGSATCNHVWNKNECIECGAHKLFDFQVEGCRAIERANGRFAVLDEMGLGKTIQGLGYLKFHRHDAWPFLWVTKAGPIYQHAAEIARVIGVDAFPQVIRSGNQYVIPNLNAIASYDIFRRMDLSKFEPFKCIVLDECQAIKNPDSTRTQCIRKIAKQRPDMKIIPLSGTFWKNRGSEAFVMLNMLDPAQFASFDQFKHNNVDYYYEGTKTKEGGIRNPEKFLKSIDHIAIRRERKEVLPELPQITRKTYLCEVPDYCRDAYKKEEDKLVKLYNEAVISGEENTFATNALIQQTIMVMRQIVGIGKVPAAVELVQDFLEETNRKAAIFVHHIQCGEMIYKQMEEFCKENNYKMFQVTGGMDSGRRYDIQTEFNATPKAFLIGSTLASGEGLNLQTCSDCYMHERQWNPANEEQAEGRFIRIGQKSDQVNATYIHGEDTVDTVLHKKVEKKRVFFHQAMNRGEMPVWNEMDLTAEIVKEIVDRRR